MRIPSLFVSHGAPTLAIDPGQTGPLLAGLGQSLPAPQSILVVSAHWDTPQPAVGITPRPKTIHDFGGFPAELYTLQYPAPGAPELARRARELLIEAGFEAIADAYRGLDHGAWVPLRYLYPEADIPVTQLSIQSSHGPDHHYRLGQALTPLRDEGVLILASGAVTHNLADFTTPDPSAPARDYVVEFSDWIARHLAAGNIEDLLDYRRRAPCAARAQPTEDHLLPLFVALGAAAGEPARRHEAGVTYGILAMDIYTFD